MTWGALAASAGLTCLLAPLPAKATPTAQADLSRLSLEERAASKITPISRRAESLSGAAALVFVVGPGDIRRSRARTLPEVIQMAPSLAVQRVEAFDYGVSARGLNGEPMGFERRNLAPDVDLDLRLRFASDVPEELAGGSHVLARAEADARHAWRMTEWVELPVAESNLLDAAHPDAAEPGRTEVRRSVQAGLRFNW
jgi:hypothetical protein